jgi:uncharacterized protein with HEPN domain
MSRVYELYLRDILKAIERIKLHTNDVDEEAFKAGDISVDGVLFNLMIIGEAVKNIPDEVKTQIPEVRWRDIGRFRDRVVHHYFALKLDIVWEIITLHLPVLQTSVEKLLEDLQNYTTDDNSSE